MECFPRQQVDGYRIRAERVDDDQIERCCGSFLQLLAAVSNLDVDLPARILQERKQSGIAGNALDKRIDLEEGPGSASLGVA